MKKIDQRYLKSEKAIIEAFQNLLLTQGFKETTTTQIIQTANVNRATFYAHYPDKYALLDAFEQDQLNKIKKQLEVNQSNLTNSRDAIRRYLLESVTYLYQNKELFKILLNSNGDHAFIQQLSQAIQKSWVDRQIINQFKLPPEYAAAVLTGILCSLIEIWIKNDCRESLDAFVEMIISTLSGIVNFNL